MKRNLNLCCMLVFCVLSIFATNNTQSVSQNKLILKTNKKSGESIEIYTYAHSEVEITGVSSSWKNDALVAYTINTTDGTITITGDLEIINISHQDITSIDLSMAQSLRQLYADRNHIKHIDFSNSNHLQGISLENNQLASLDLSQLTELTTLYCANNALTTLDISKNKKLVRLVCYNNALTQLDCSRNTALQHLVCSNNPLNTLDVSAQTALETFYCANIQLETLNLSNNPQLTTLQCSNNRLSSLILTHNPRLRNLQCYGNNINGEAMQQTIASLPETEGEDGLFIVIDSKNNNEGNACYENDVRIAKQKGWRMYDLNGKEKDKVNYEGIRNLGIDGLSTDKNSNISITTDGQTLHVKGLKTNETIRCYYLNGQLAATQRAGILGETHFTLPFGTYVLKTETESIKVWMK